MKQIGSRRGVTLVELMITLTIFSIIIGMIYSVYNTFLKQATTERKVTKTEMDMISVVWPLAKEIQSAGFGTPVSGDCGTPMTLVGSTLAIHSTAAGNDEHAGKWSYVGSDCSVTGLPSTVDRNVVVVSNLDRSLMGYAYVTGTTSFTLTPVSGSCNDYSGNAAYWVATTSIPPTAPRLGCYETTYALGGTGPGMCAPLTQSLRRSVSTKAGDTNFQPILDCIRDIDYRFGCISSTGNLSWQTDTDCGSSKLRLVKLGLIIQSSPVRDLQVPADITLFEDLVNSSGGSLKKPVTLTTEQRNYKWRKVEQTIPLRNLE